MADHATWPAGRAAVEPRPRALPPWLGPVMVLAVLAAIVGIGGLLWVEDHHRSMATDLTGHWVALGEHGATDLVIVAEAEAQRSADADALLVIGSLDGREIRGRIEMPAFPPWGSTAWAMLLGKRWAVRADSAGRVMKLIAEDGRVITLSAWQ